MAGRNEYIKINAFEFCTPKFFGDYYSKDRYDHEQIEYLLNKITTIPIQNRAFHRKGKMINLINFQTSDDTDFIEGTFTSAKYGQKQEIIDVYTQSKTGDKEKEHGVKNEIKFVLDKRNGLILVQHDREGVVGRDMIHRFLNHHSDLAESYREAFNTINPKAKIMKRSFVKVIALPSQEFFNALDDFVRIKEAFVMVDVEGNINNEGIEYLTNEAHEQNMEDFQEMKITYRNKVSKGGIKQVKQFLKHLSDLDKYDNYGVSGHLPSGKSKTISMAKIPHAYYEEVYVNENGIPDGSQIIRHMVRISKFDNPIINKNQGVEPIIQVGENIDD
ncbi:hypothetical protein [Bacillus sp. J33]|uniref:hypothetical protein n=1 Tax=Bacillus sp. J33 TaxID=935836 RepID=UPI00047D0364|nr:hypothetical protein [Bacillus sp. J33]